jgi:hypothetical protein
MLRDSRPGNIETGPCSPRRRWRVVMKRHRVMRAVYWSRERSRLYIGRERGRGCILVEREVEAVFWSRERSRLYFGRERGRGCILVEREVEAHTTMRTHHALQAPCCARAAAMRRHHLSASNSRSLHWPGGSPAQQACPAPWRSRHTGPPSSGPACRGTTSARKYKLQPFKFATSTNDSESGCLVEVLSCVYTIRRHASGFMHAPGPACRGTASRWPSPSAAAAAPP